MYYQSDIFGNIDAERQIIKINQLYPCIALRPYISRYWMWDLETDIPHMLPGTGAELIFTDFGLQRQQQHFTASLICLPRQTGIQFKQASQPARFFSVRFRHGAFRHFAAVNLGEINDQFITAQDIWGKSGQHIEASMTESSVLSDKIQRIESFLLKQLALHAKSEHRWLGKAFDQLYYGHSSIIFSKLSQDIGVSTRYFQKIFKQNYGITPKHFQRLARFEQVIRHLLLQQKTQYLETALDHGYYDQAHFIKEFKVLAGTVPAAFFQEKNFRTHFYNPSPPA